MRQQMKKFNYKNRPDKTTPISAGNLNRTENKTCIIQDTYLVEEVVEANTSFMIPVQYIVGGGVLDIYYLGTKLVLGEEYLEVGETEQISDRIQLKDWSADIGDVFEFVVRGEWETYE